MKSEIPDNVQKAEFAVIFHFSSFANRWLTGADVIHVNEVDPIKAT